MRRKRVWGVSLALLALGVSALVLYGQQPVGQPVEATVVSVTGTVEVKLTPDGQYQPVAVGMKIPEGATISTGVRSTVELDFDGHSAVIIKRLSIVRVDRSQMTEAAVETRLHLQVGTVKAGVVKERIASDFKVTTPAVTLSARGTEIADVTHSERGTEVQMGTEGLLDMTKFFSPAHATRSIPPGGATNSRFFTQIVDGKKMGQSSRSYRYGRTGPEDKSAGGDPSNLEDPKSEYTGEQRHPEFVRILFQQATMCRCETPSYAY